jgi:hypothetical protein
MAKKAENSVLHTKQKRVERIKSCIQCNGAPPSKEVNLQGIITSYCELCMEVIDYTKTNVDLPKVKKVKQPEVVEEEIIPTIMVDKTQHSINFNDIILE